MTRDEQIEEIYRLITELAAGNLNYRAPISEKDNELDAITMGINMLAEELQTTTVSRNYLSRLYRGVVDMLFVLDSEYNIEEVNEAVVSTLGFEAEELLQKHFTYIFTQEQGQNREDPIFGELSANGSCYNAERRFRTQWSSQIPVSISCSQLYDDAGRVTGVLCIAKDITRLKETEEVLRARNDELNTLIYRVSHDLKGPLSSVSGLLNLARADLNEPDTLTSYLDLMEQSITRLNDILRDFLELGRLTQGETHYEPVYFDIIIPAIMTSLSFSDGFKGIHVEVDIQQQKPFVASAAMMNAIIQNLIENGVKYADASKDYQFLKVSVKDDREGVEIIVQDNGIGISSNLQERIFKMFFRGTTQSTGSGLGLYTVQKCVEMMGGNISVKSKPGEGSTFTAYLPSQEDKVEGVSSLK